MVDKGKASSVQSKQIIEEDDVFQDDSGMARCIEGDEIIGMDKGAKKRTFKFSNFTADKEEFLPLKNGDVFENVKKLKDKLKELQINIDKAPDLKQLKEEESIVLQEYVTSMKDEEKILYQKQKSNGYEVQVKQMENINMIINNKLFKAEANEMVRDVSDAKIKELLTEINSTMITLVPKIQSPEQVIDFRPIACCNVLYKCINNIITERMNKFLRKLVDKNQSAFVPNMHIQDNILVSQELLKGYERKERPKRVAMKIDIHKAYDIENWKFLECVKNRKEFKYHFGCRIMKLIHACFADDLLIFCHGDINSVNVLKEAIEDFGAYSV
ncbi:RNA-directed DNA polymerase, eukaryota, reverse transcriptase zinc-binding domain protein [Tanacetum coccineum]